MSPEEIPAHWVSFFSAEVLALYSNQPDKYKVDTDYFSGEIETSGDHYERSSKDKGENLIHVKFGFRTRKDGDLALAVWMSDLDKSSPDEQAKWSGFLLNREALVTGADARFEMWVERYINANWDVESGVIERIKYTIRELNAMCFCTVGVTLFKYEDLHGLGFPLAQNNHRYHDAHSEAYKLLIDGLNRDALLGLAANLGVTLKNAANAKTLALLKALLPEDLRVPVLEPFNFISEQRRLADHQNRPKARRMEAFEQFNGDIENVEAALGHLKVHLATSLKVTVDSCLRRREAMSVLYPSFDPARRIEPHYSICDIKKVERKTIARVEYGWREHHPRIHNSELIILHFDDGSSMAIHAASNVMNLSELHDGLKPDDLNVSFALNYVPPIERTP